MRETLYLRLGNVPGDAPDSDVEFAVAAADARVLRVQRGALAEAATLAAGRRLVVFVPAADVRLSSVRVPARQPNKVLQAVPYALEDQVAEDVDTLHFAIGTRTADGAYPVAILARARLNGWLAKLTAARLRPEALIPEQLALRADDAHWSALAEDSQVIVRPSTAPGFSCLPEDFEAYLDLAGATPDQALHLHLAGEATRDWSRLSRPVQLFPHASALSVLVAQYQPERAINLLQGAQAQSRDLDRLWKPWRLAASLLLALVLIAGVGKAVNAARLGAELERQDAANLARFQQLFPDQTRVVDLSAQLDQQLRLLNGGSGAGSPFPLLESLAQALGASPGLKLTGMQFREGALFVSLTASDLQVLEGLRNWYASARGARLEVQSANAESGTVQIRARLVAA